MNFSRLELLPNEILMEIFEYLDARDSYQAFYGFNLRFKLLLQSLNQLYLHIHYDRRNRIRHDHLIALRIHTLIIDRNRFIDNLYRFPNIRNLIFIKSSAEKIERVIDQIANLEHLTIKVKQSGIRLCSLYQRIFTNDFPYLKSCILTNFQPQSLIDTWTQTPSIHSLHITSDFSRIHMSLLAACPNLHFLKLNIPQLAVTRLDVQLHKNLKRLNLTFRSDQWPFDDFIFNTLFACIPNFEHLYIQQLIANTEVINSLNASNWLATLLTGYLVSLRKFKLTLRLSDNQHFDIHQLKTNFLKAHNYRYGYELEII
jgi:hypothetical protein